MASKQKIKRTNRRSQNQQNKGRIGIQTYGLIMAVVVLAVAVVATFVILDQGEGRSQPQLGEVSLDKSDGAEDAPVVVVEYGDFQ